MTLAFSGPLQSAVFARLSAAPAVVALVGEAVFDALPLGPLPPLYVTLGAEEVRDRSDTTAQGALHRFSLAVISDSESFLSAKSVASALCAALLEAPLVLTQGQVTSLRFDRAQATRRNGGGRQITLWFAARIDAG